MSHKKLLETEKSIARRASFFRQNYPEYAQKIEQEAIKEFEDHWLHSRYICDGLGHSVFILTKSYLDPQARFPVSADDVYRIKTQSAGLLGNKIRYSMLIPDSQYVAIDAILNFAHNHNIPASFSWTSLSPKA